VNLVYPHNQTRVEQGREYCRECGGVSTLYSDRIVAYEFIARSSAPLDGEASGASSG